MKSGVSMNWGGFGKAIKQAGKKLNHKSEMLESIGEALVSGTIARFDQEKAPDGSPWTESDRAREQGGKTLTDTARLRDSISWAITDDAVMVGSNVIYARIHQMGGVTGKGHKVKMPARPYLGVSKEDMEEVKATMEDFIAGLFT